MRQFLGQLYLDLQVARLIISMSCTFAEIVERSRAFNQAMDEAKGLDYKTEEDNEHQPCDEGVMLAPFWLFLGAGISGIKEPKRKTRANRKKKTQKSKVGVQFGLKDG